MVEGCQSVHGYQYSMYYQELAETAYKSNVFELCLSIDHHFREEQSQ